MEIISEWFDKIIKYFAMEVFFAKAQWVDWWAIIFGAFGLVYGIVRGILREIVEIMELVLTIFIIFELYPKVGLFISNQMHGFPYQYVDFAAYFVTTTVISVFVFFLDFYLRRLFHTKLVAWIRILGGMVLGSVQFLLIWSILANALYLYPIHKIQRLFELGNSFTGHTIVKIAPTIHEFLVPYWPFAKAKKETAE